MRAPNEDRATPVPFHSEARPNQQPVEVEPVPKPHAALQPDRGVCGLTNSSPQRWRPSVPPAGLTLPLRRARSMFSHTLTVSWCLQPDTSRGFCCKVRKARTLWISQGNAGSPGSYLSSTTPSVLHRSDTPRQLYIEAFSAPVLSTDARQPGTPECLVTTHRTGA